MAHPPHTELFHIYWLDPGEGWVRSVRHREQYSWKQALERIASQNTKPHHLYRIVSTSLGYNAYRWEGKQADARVDAKVILDEKDYEKFHEAIDQLNTPNTQEEVMTPDLQQPLTIPRTTLIKTLQTNVDKLAQERADAEAAEASRRKVVLDAIAELTPDELYNIFVEYYTVDVERLKNDHDNKYFVTREIVPTKVETDTEKFIRVLGLANDENIEVTPNEELYRLI